ncbi:GTP-binding protein [Shimia sp. R11_0]|uniref:CobW family GTP-binding protein n=1 Tax=Shimia sp. R11_0 TaxID=2821096 RepID=UPI001ADCFAA7|nr:GTP-binding protein [Shimia sp. R11_0]MBO9478420.1 GTP-binding protein [Shimia sp. R11_0]
MAETRLPITLLTGFLGAGKSTLLNAVLSDSCAGRIAVVVNEFGEVGLDHDLIEATDEEVVLMSSGCLCCSIRGDLSDTLAGLMERRESGSLAFDRIVIETTGLADPAPIRQTLIVDPYLARNTMLDGVVTLVDAINGQATLDAQFEAVSQAATADLLLISKTDLAHRRDVKALHTRLEALNPSAKIITTREAKQSPALLFGLSGMRRGLETENVLAWMARETRAPMADPLANLSGLSQSTSKPTLPPHDARIETASIQLEAPLDDRVFDHWLDTLVALKGPDLLRVKGIVFLKDIPTPFVFHGVQHIFDPPVPLNNWPKDDTTTRIVVIARDMTSKELERSFDMLRATKAPPQPDVFPGWQETEQKNWP